MNEWSRNTSQWVNVWLTFKKVFHDVCDLKLENHITWELLNLSTLRLQVVFFFGWVAFFISQNHKFKLKILIKHNMKNVSQARTI